RVELVRRRHRAAGGYDLDLIDVAADVLARGAAHLVGSIGDEADHAHAAVDRIRPLRTPPFVAVAAGLRDVAAGHEQARPDEMALIQRPPKPVIGAAGVAHGAHALNPPPFAALH